MKSKLVNSVALLVSILMKFISSLIAKWKKILLYQRSETIKFFSNPSTPAKGPKVLIAIAHITSEQDARDPLGSGKEKVERLTATIDSILNSLAHCQLTITVHTLPHRNVVAGLPEYQQQLIQVVDTPDCDPMFVEYRIQDVFMGQAEDYDWFMLIEDDILILDSLFLEKISHFNDISSDVSCLLTPNRYEMYQGKKSYIDITISRDCAWSEVSSIVDNGVKFSECVNPHSAMYCLSKDQLRHWEKSGRTWKNQIVMVGPLESAATFCLLESFNLYKPHPQNLNYLEVRHFDTKYSKMHPGPSPFILSPVA